MELKNHQKEYVEVAGDKAIASVASSLKEINSAVRLVAATIERSCPSCDNKEASLKGLEIANNASAQAILGEAGCEWDDEGKLVLSSDEGTEGEQTLSRDEGGMDLATLTDEELAENLRAANIEPEGMNREEMLAKLSDVLQEQAEE